MCWFTSNLGRCYAAISKSGETCCFQVGPTKKDTDIMRSKAFQKPSKTNTVTGDHGTNIPLTSNQPPLGGNSLLRTATGSDLFKAFLLLSAMGFVTIEEKTCFTFFSNHLKEKSNGSSLIWILLQERIF